MYETLGLLEARASSQPLVGGRMRIGVRHRAIPNQRGPAAVAGEIFRVMRFRSRRNVDVIRSRQ